MAQKPLQAFLDTLIDYAGLFPPAELDMATAIRNYVEYVESADKWMMSRFICPAGRLEELSQNGEKYFSSERPLRFSVLAGGGTTGADLEKKLDTNLNQIGAFCDRHPEMVMVDTLEIRMPAKKTATDVDAVSDWIRAVNTQLENAGMEMSSAFFEAPQGDLWRDRASTLIAALRNTLEEAFEATTEIGTRGFKLRCGGVESHMYPTPEEIAFVIDYCKTRQIAMKATAGLHHPVRHYNAEASVKMHGFLNVFGAGILTAVHDLTVPEIEEIIADEDPANFLFTERAFAWQNIRCSSDDIIEARSRSVISYGSCSFDEPRDDLRALGLLSA